MEIDTGKEKRLLIRFDGRTKFARDFRDARKRLIEERGGLPALDAVQLDAINDFAFLSLERKRMAAERQAGGEIDLDQYGTLCDRCNRLARIMGDPIKKTVQAPTFDERLAARRAARCAG